jgi:hypothetical protein
LFICHFLYQLSALSLACFYELVRVR